MARRRFPIGLRSQCRGRENPGSLPTWLCNDLSFAEHTLPIWPERMEGKCEHYIMAIPSPMASRTRTSPTSRPSAILPVSSAKAIPSCHFVVRPASLVLPACLKRTRQPEPRGQRRHPIWRRIAAEASGYLHPNTISEPFPVPRSRPKYCPDFMGEGRQRVVLRHLTLTQSVELSEKSPK